MDIGIIGFGYMGKWHYRKLLEMKFVNHIYIYDTDKNSVTMADWNNIIVCRNAEELLSTASIQLVVIATPNNTHSLYIETALRNGKHVICEKPVTLDAKKLELLIQLSHEKHLLLTVHQNRRWDKDYLTVKSALQTLDMGEITSIESRVYGQRGVMYGWRANQENGGGLLLDWGVHLVDQILMLQPQQRVVAVGANIRSIRTKTVDDYFSIRILFDNQVSAHIECGIFALQLLPRWFIYADNATLRIDDFSCDYAKVSYINNQKINPSLHAPCEQYGSTRLMQPLIENQINTIDILPPAYQEDLFYKNIWSAINDEIPLLVKCEQVLRTMKVLDAAKEAVQGCSVQTDI
jgi:scyllo-inositol 2-dehydrogenase (NADP+)